MDRSFYRFVTIHACDRRTDRRTDRILITIPRPHYMQRGKKHNKSITYKVADPYKRSFLARACINIVISL